jgi:ribonuclease H2 subunit A
MQMRNKYNLNSLSYDAVYSILERIKAFGAKVEHVYVDTLGKPETYKRQLSERFPAYSFTVCSKADSIYPVVGAASIFAKVTRDFNLENWKPDTLNSLQFDRNFGSGYPSGKMFQLMTIFIFILF